MRTGPTSSSRSDPPVRQLSAIVVAFGKERLLAECLVRLEGALERVAGPTELVVVVNALSAEMTADLRSRPDTITVTGSPGLGFAGGVAAGLAAVDGEWIALVNDDCLVEEQTFAELLLAAESGDDIGSVAAQVRFAGRPDVVNSAGVEVDVLGIARERRLGDPVSAVETEPTEVFGASGTLALYRRSMLDELGGFDTSFFAYLEDADLAWRARMAGWRCVFAPLAIAYHGHSSTLTHGSDAKHTLVGRNRVRMLAKNASAELLRRSAFRIAIYDLLYVAYAGVTSRTTAPLRGRLQGIAEWRAYRHVGQARRRPVELSPSTGLRGALARNRVYRSPLRPTEADGPG
jgi:GT2 family glycosyltransferase